MPDSTVVIFIAQKELRDAQRNRWLLLYTAAFAALSLSLSWMSLSTAGRYGVAGFGRTTATLINLVLLIVPLMGLTLGAQSLAAERDRGTLAYLMAQPISKSELLLGKFCGTALALLASLSMGFGLTGIIIALNGGGAAAGVYVMMAALAFLLALVALSIGFLLSAVAGSSASAISMALFIWLLLVFFGDLGILGTALVMRLDIAQLLALTLLNPLQLFKVSAVLGIRGSLELLGPAGVYATRTFGRWLMPLLLALLITWIVAPIAGSLVAVKKRGII